MKSISALEDPLVAPPVLLEARGLCKFYGGREVLHEVSLAIHAREIVTIVGPNGAGKTTLLRCLLGLEAPDYGTVAPAPDLRIGYVPQQFRPQPSMPLTVRSFLALYGRDPAGLTDMLHVGPLLNTALAQLSGGELRRVLLLRALLREPQLLVLDEPTAGVDAAGQGKLYGLLKTLRDKLGFAVLMVSHDLHVVMASTERVICLQQHICCEGTPEQVGGNAAFRTLFGDALADQLALYHHHHSHAHGLGGDYPPAPHTHGDHAGHRHG